MRPVKENAEKTGAKRVGPKMGFYLGTPVDVCMKTCVPQLEFVHRSSNGQFDSFMRVDFAFEFLNRKELSLSPSMAISRNRTFSN